MKLSRRLRRGLSRAAYMVAAMLFGACALTRYLEWADPGFKEVGSTIAGTLFGPFLLFCVIGSALDPSSKPKRAWSGGRHPDYSGAIAVAVMGFSAAVILWVNRRADEDLILSIIIVIATIVGTFAAWRFAKIKGAEIGEARFRSPTN